MGGHSQELQQALTGAGLVLMMLLVQLHSSSGPPGYAQAACHQLQSYPGLAYPEGEAGRLQCLLALPVLHPDHQVLSLCCTVRWH